MQYRVGGGVFNIINGKKNIMNFGVEKNAV